MKTLIKGKRLYFAKRGKSGQMVGSVLGSGVYKGIQNGRHVFQYDTVITYTPLVSKVIVYSLS